MFSVSTVCINVPSKLAVMAGRVLRGGKSVPSEAWHSQITACFVPVRSSSASSLLEIVFFLLAEI